MGRLVTVCSVNSLRHISALHLVGVALGAYLAQATRISYTMLMAAAETIPELISDEAKAKGQLYPGVDNIREVSNSVAAAVSTRASISLNALEVP